MHGDMMYGGKEGEMKNIRKMKRNRNNKSDFPRIRNVIFPEFNLTAKPTSNICPLQYLTDSI